MKPKYKKNDKIKLLDFSHETYGNCPYEHFWVEGMNKFIGETFIILNTKKAKPDDIFYTLNNPGTSWGFNEHWLGDPADLLPKELFEI